MPIEKVEVQVVDITQGTSIPLLKKMNSSMQIVAEQLLQDKDVEATEAVKADYEKISKILNQYNFDRSTNHESK